MKPTTLILLLLISTLAGANDRETAFAMGIKIAQAQVDSDYKTHCSFFHRDDLIKFQIAAIGSESFRYVLNKYFEGTPAVELVSIDPYSFCHKLLSSIDSLSSMQKGLTTFELINAVQENEDNIHLLYRVSIQAPSSPARIPIETIVTMTLYKSEGQLYLTLPDTIQLLIKQYELQQELASLTTTAPAHNHNINNNFLLTFRPRDMFMSSNDIDNAPIISGDYYLELSMLKQVKQKKQLFEDIQDLASAYYSATQEDDMDWLFSLYMPDSKLFFSPEYIQQNATETNLLSLYGIQAGIRFIASSGQCLFVGLEYPAKDIRTLLTMEETENGLLLSARCNATKLASAISSSYFSNQPELTDPETNEEVILTDAPETSPKKLTARSHSTEPEIRSEDAVRATLDRSKGALYAIYNRALRQDPTLEGIIVFEFTIEPDGSISSCEVISSELNNTSLESKLVARMMYIHFGKEHVSQYTTRWALSFSPF